MTSSRGTNLLLVGIFLVFSTALMAADQGVVPAVTELAGPELWIDGPDNVQPDDPNFPDVAVDAEGRRIQVWEAFGDDRLDIYLRRFDANGNPLEDPRRINSTIEKEQHFPRVAVSSDGSFLVIYQSSETPSGQTFDQYMVRSQAFDASGNPVGGEQLVSMVPTHEQVNVYADVAALRTVDGSPGGYIVAWRNSQFLGDGWGDIRGSLVSVAGVPGAEFRLNAASNGTERWSSVTELNDGGFLVVWVETSTQEVRGRRFNAAGGPVGGNFKINTFNNAAPTSSTDAAVGWDGRVLIVWEDSGSENPPLPAGSNTEIRGQMLDADLSPLGNDFRINNLFAGIQRYPRIAELGPVGFLVTWNSDTVSAGPDTTESVEARVVSGPGAFDADGDGTDDNQVQYNVWDNNAGQNYPAAHGWYGRLATTWQSNTWDGEPEPDTIDQNFLIGRDLDYCLFCDDFEWFIQEAQTVSGAG